MPWRTILRMRAGGRYGTVGNRNKMKQEWLNMVERFHHVYIMFIMCFCPKMRYYRSQMGIFNADWIHISNPFQLGYHISDKAISISCLCNRIYPQVGMGLSLVQLHPKGGFGVDVFFFPESNEFFAGDVESKNPSTFGKTVYFMIAFTYYNLYTSKPTIYIYIYIRIYIYRFVTFITPSKYGSM